MRPNGDKIIVKLGADNDYVYFSVRDSDDNASIIDFVQQRQRISLGAVTRESHPGIPQVEPGVFSSMRELGNSAGCPELGSVFSDS